jgi:hypothetical protein
MRSHKERMAEIGFWRIPPAGSDARNRLDAAVEHLNKDVRHKDLVKEIFKKARALVSVQSQNGIGFPADKQLREHNVEYNGRVFKGSLWDMPSSFNVVEAFNKFLPHSATFELRPERDHLFSFQHFIDWVTSGAVEDNQPDLRHLLAQGQIYSYSSTDHPSELCFAVEGGEQFGFASMSCIRFENEVSLIFLAGQRCDLEKETKGIRIAWENMRRLPHRAHIEPDDSMILRAEPLIEGENFWKTVVLMRFDIEKKTVDARYILKDWGTSYDVQTDDLSTYIDPQGNFFSDDIKKTYDGATEKLRKYQSLFELSKTCLLLPQFFNTYDDNIVVERHPTGFKEFRSRIKNKKIVERVDARHWITHREVYVLRKPSVHSPDRAYFVAPEYKIETSGFWRKLPIGTEGRDKLGRPIHGRTWVSQTLSWVEESSVAPAVFVKTGENLPTSSNSGFIYVMRSAAHERDVFKIGMTRRTSDERARELSCTTSSPDHFLVVEEWATRDCVQAERLIHAKLAEFRINPNRENFRAKYRVILSVIDEIITSIEGISKM